ncbi:Glutamate receptor ionotropic, kainate 2-like 1, partial [Homarus americanus]
VLVGLWLMFCVVIITGFRSSLIAHLTVQGKSKPPETFEDLVSLNHWRWGIESWILNGAVLLYFSKHSDPVVQQIYRDKEILPAAEGLQKVRAGGYSFLSINYYITVVVASQYTDSYGQTPFYISKKGIELLAAFGWAFRH